MDMMKFWGVAIGFMLFLWYFSPSESVQDDESLNLATIAQLDAEGNPVSPASSGGVEIIEKTEEFVAPYRFKTGKVPISTKRGVLNLVLGFAYNREQHAMGLMHHREWPRNMHGLLFLFDKEDTYNIWMKNTHLSLDVLFIDREGYIVQIATGTTPLSQSRIKAREPVLGVLEIPAGTAKKWQLTKGDRIRLKYFRSALPKS